MNAKRRLPVLQTPADEGEPVRPAWQWSVFGAVLLVLLWVVLMALASPILTRLAGSWPLTVALEFAIQALASGLVGWVVGTWSPRRGVREGALAGTYAAAFAGLLGASLASFDSGILSSGAWVALVGGLVLVPWSTAFAGLGARIGSRKKRVLAPP